MNTEISVLNDTVSNSVGFAEKNGALSTAIVALSEDKKENNGDFGYNKVPCPSTVKFYQLLSVDTSDNIHLVKDSQLKSKDKRRHMASTSVRNMASHIAAISYANFIPCCEKWIGPQGLPRGCKKLLEIMKLATGAHFQLVIPSILLNKDCTS